MGSLGMGFLGAMMMPYNMQMYEWQTSMYLIFGLLIFCVIMCCCCGCFGLAYCFYTKDEANKRRRDEHRQDARKDEMGLKTIQVLTGSNKQEERQAKPAHVRHDSW